MDIEELPNADLLEALDTSSVMTQLTTFEGWKLIEESCKRISKQAQEDILIANAKTEMEVIIEKQVMVKLYRNVIPGIVKSLTDIGEDAFNEAKDRELIKKT
jgi:hypothetical protein